MKTVLAVTISILFILLAGCSHVKTVSSDIAPESPAPVGYSVVYYIHGDSDYLFHMDDGTPAEADEQALSRAKKVAEQAESGEVFIFHQKPRKKRLGLFPRRSNRLYHYRNGELINRVQYRLRSDDEPFLTTEAALYHDYRSVNPDSNHRSFFLYFGHEIPLYPNQPYHATLPDIDVYTGSFAAGVERFHIRSNGSHDLVVLSTCSNATPVMAKGLKGLTDVLLASPQNLHLSHIDTGKLSLLESEPDIQASTLADAMAKETYQRLSETILTVITLSIYEMDRLSPYIDRLYERTARHLETEKPNIYRDNIDCEDLDFFEEGRYRDGVKVWYRAPAFGRQADRTGHSGWGCKGV